jgi:acetoacetyl-CoA synthetase
LKKYLVIIKNHRIQYEVSESVEQKIIGPYPPAMFYSVTLTTIVITFSFGNLTSEVFKEVGKGLWIHIKQRYAESYYDKYPGTWRHGDWIKITDRGSAVITGRSDSTLKRMGVRMGSSDFYSAVEDLPEVMDSLIVGFDTPEGGYYMPLFVVLREGLILDDSIKEKINIKIRNSLSSRHLPDAIFNVTDIPRTLNNKKLEVPVKKILMGFPVKKSVNLDSMSNPKAMDYFIEIAGKFDTGNNKK